MAATTTMQLNLFGAPEPLTSYGRELRGRGDDLPVPSERELLWPACLLDELTHDGATAEDAAALLERLYGDVPRRTRLKIDECTRRLRCDRMTILRHIHETGELSAVDIGSGDTLPAWRIYRASFVLFLARREFGQETSRTDAKHEDAERLGRALARLRRRGRE